MVSLFYSRTGFVPNFQSSRAFPSSPQGLARSAWTAVAQWTYQPYLLNGNPTEVEPTITVNYMLNP